MTNDPTSTYPPAPDLSAADVRDAIQKSGAPRPIFVVLDDDPTGTQSVADLPVLTAWTGEDFAWAFAQDPDAIYVMTNSRSLSPADAEAVTRDVVSAANAAAAADASLDRPLAFVSRSDSTLRGHFPLEPDTIADCVREAGGHVDGIVVVPAFPDAGRITVGGMHYAKVGDEFVPAGDTEFARDKSFGYTSSRLADWVEEKTGGAIPASSVTTIDLAAIRTDPAAVQAAVDSLDGGVLAPDIATEEDLRALSLALIKAEAAGKSFIYRVGPPFVRARIGMDVPTPLTSEEVDASRAAASPSDARPQVPGGLVVVGSHVDLTTRQLAGLMEAGDVPRIEIDVPTVIDPATRDAHVADVAARAIDALSAGTAIVTTSRQLVSGADADSSLAISRDVSAAVVDVVQQVIAAVIPRFVIAKGGITSSDVASKGLSIRHARVVGPMLPGIVSLWSPADGPAAGVPYIVFAGNVGDETSLRAVVDTLSA